MQVGSVSMTVHEDNESEAALACVKLQSISGSVQHQHQSLQAELTVDTIFVEDMTRGSVCRRQLLLSAWKGEASTQMSNGWLEETHPGVCHCPLNPTLGCSSLE